MRKIILYLHMSLDTVVSDLEKWMNMTDELIQESMEHYKTIDTVIFGSKTYPSMADYWQKAEKSSNSETEKEFAKKINEVKNLFFPDPVLNWFGKIQNYLILKI